jgi:hypothetical protein
MITAQDEGMSLNTSVRERRPQDEGGRDAGWWFVEELPKNVAVPSRVAVLTDGGRARSSSNSFWDKI